MHRLGLIATALMLSTSAASATGIETAILAVGSWYAGLGVAGQFAVQIGIGLALAAASAGISYLISGGGKRQEQAIGDSGNLSSQSGVQVEEFSGLLERRRLYGTQVVSGGIFFQKTVAGSGTLDIFVKGYAISDGICDALEAVIINGVEVPVDSSGNPQIEPWYDVGGNYLKASFRSGRLDQAMDPIIAARWPTPPDDFYPDLESGERTSRWAKFRQRGISTVVIEMHFGDDAEHQVELWGAGGIPDVKFKVRGLWLYDPRNGNHDVEDNLTWRWSQNATLAEADWLMIDMGFGVAPSEIEWESVKDSASVDDRWMPTLAGRERRGRVNGVVVGSEANDAVLSSMALQNRALIRKAFGQYSIRADRVSDPVATIHSGLVIGSLSFQNEPDTRALINRVVAQFAPAEKFNQSAETAYEDGVLVTADGQTLEQRLSLRFGDSPAEAQRLAYAQVKENRAGRTLTIECDISVLIAAGKPNGQLLEVGDVVRVDFDNYEALNALYTISGLEIAQGFTVTLSLSGYTPTALGSWGVDLETPFEDAA